MPTIRLKRGSSAPTELDSGEPAVNLTSGVLYIGRGEEEQPYVVGGDRVAKAGDEMTGSLTIGANGTTAPLRLPNNMVPQADPSQLANGDLWHRSSQLYARLGSSTRTLIHNGNPTTLASDVTQSEAEAGTSTTRRWWTAQRVRQAIASWWSTRMVTGQRLLGNPSVLSAGATEIPIGSGLLFDGGILGLAFGEGDQEVPPGDHVHMLRASYHGAIASPENGTIWVDPRIPAGRQITEFFARCGAGSCTATLKRGTSTVGTISVTTSSSTSSLSNTSLSVDQELTLEISNNASCEDLRFAVRYQQDVFAYTAGK